MRFFKNVLGTFLTEVSLVACNLLIGILTARVLGPERRGILTLVMTLPMTLVAFTDPGMSQSNVFFIRRKQASPATIAINSAFLAAVIGGLTALGLWLGRGLALSTVLRSLPPHYLTMILCLAPLLLLYTFWMAILRAWEHFRLFNLLRLLMPAAILVLMALALLVFRGGIGWATAAYAAGVAGAAVIGLVVVAVLVHPRLPLDWGLLKASLTYGGKSYAQTLVGHLTYRLDIYLVALFLPPEQIAFYGIATSLAELVWYIPNSVGMVLFPKLSGMDDHAIHEVTAEVCRHTLLVTAFVSIGVLVMGFLGVPLLYGAEYAPAVPPLLILLPGTTIMTLYKVLTRNFSSRNRQQITIIAAVLGLTLNGIFDWILIPQLGIVGAAIGSTLAYSAAGGVLLLAFLRESGLGWQAVFRFNRNDLRRYQEVQQAVKARLAKGFER